MAKFIKPYERHVNVNGTLAGTSGVTSSRLPRRIHRRRRRLRPRCHHLCRCHFIVAKSVSITSKVFLLFDSILDVRKRGSLIEVTEIRSRSFLKRTKWTLLSACGVFGVFPFWFVNIPARKSCVRSIISRGRATLDDEDHDHVVRWRGLGPQVTRMRRPAWNETELDDVNRAF